MNSIKLITIIIMGLMTGCEVFTPIDISPSPTAKKILTYTNLPYEKTKTPFAEIIPTLSKQEKVSRISYLMNNNNGCMLPCWWGISPGRSTWDYGKEVLGPISDLSENKKDDLIFAESLVELPEDYIETTGFLTIYLLIENNLVKEIEVFDFNNDDLSISNFLKSYGKPEEIWIKTWSQYPGLPDKVPFSVILNYPQKGIIARYHGDADIIGNSIHACFQSPWLILWDSKDVFDFQNRILYEDSTEYLPIEKATGLTIDQFFNKYSKQGTQSCIETKKNLWKGT